jgi:hypothetical protein
MMQLSWEGKYPKPGRYFNSPLWFLRPKPYNFKKILQPEFSEILFSDLDITDYIGDDIYHLTNKIKSYRTIEIISKLPPWRFFGDSFDLSVIGYKPDNTRAD